jgi:hypothetical protein
VATSRARKLGALAALVGTPVAVLIAAIAWPSPVRPEGWVDHRAFAQGPVEARTVYWVGHSLMNAVDSYVDGSTSLMERVGALARARGLAYGHFDHTLWGSPLSVNYRGAAHSFDRSAPEMAERRRELTERGQRYDAMVLTESLPLRSTRPHEHTEYYLGRFACEYERANPNGRVYLFESWPNLQSAHGSDGLGSPARWDWARRLREDRAEWEGIADRASRGGLMAPGLLGRLERWTSPPTCRPAAPIFLVPVGTVLARLAERLERERVDYAGERLAPHHLFVNPYLDWPADWPRDDVDEDAARRVLTTLPRRHPNADPDDIHASDLGIYVNALVHFAVLYRQSPEGLPPLAEGLSAETAARLQALVWEVVRDDPRTGITGDAMLTN